MLTALACGAVVFPGLFYGFRKILTLTFTNWTDADIVSVSERLVSAVHASLSSATGIIVATSCNNVMTDRHWLVNEFAVFAGTYMVMDIFAMYLSHFHVQRVRSSSSLYSSHSLKSVKAFLSRDWLLVLHHSALIFVFLPITVFFRRGLGDFFVGCFYNAELSTPFVCFGKILIQLGLDNTRLYRVNGVFTLLTFFMCRILIFPFMYWMYARQLGIPLLKAPFSLPWHCNAGNLAVLLPQIYWFSLLLKKAMRLYRRQKKVE
ncbi:TLC domain-containing protein 3A-like [Nerophis ophidion]|uniref:TLC domain-containing protein 3A-like n=1 Tax=Nerophis ophidion TaxID=159077 RepID=UPI002ADF853F|nr:TLC domain-containing protein 3A-like [Nerophis ophidion]